jgi:hypothetical protein
MNNGYASDLRFETIPFLAAGIGPRIPIVQTTLAVTDLHLPACQTSHSIPMKRPELR